MQKKLLFCLLLAATLSAPLAAQTPTYDISGTVTDAVTGEPLPGVFITYDKRKRSTCGATRLSTSGSPNRSPISTRWS